jgi:type IV pilus assembly protein PilW
MTRLGGRCRVPARVARGFTFVEIMIAMLIGLFLIGGMLTLVQAMRRTFTSQSGMSVLQDNERMAMQLITDVVQSTGYYTTPFTNTAVASFPVAAYTDANFSSAGQALTGTGVFGVPNHDITSRYQTAGGDNIINCTGNSSTIPATWVNQFSITTVGGLSYLTCNLWVNNNAQPTTVALIPGVTNMQILYGVTTGNGEAYNSVDTYLDASTVTNWNSVRSVQVTLTFTNPVCGQPAQATCAQLGLASSIFFTRTITVMSKTGVTT